MVGEGNFRNILCGVDLSADAPVVEAHRIAGGSDAGPPLTFLHVLPGDFPGAPMSPAGAAQAVIDRERLARTVGDALEARVAQLTGRDARSSRFEIEGGVPSEVIVRRAGEIAADLVVIGRSSRADPAHDVPLGKALLGRTATSVVREAPCSVLVVRQVLVPRSGMRVLAAVDLLDGTAQVVRIAAVQAARMGAGLTLLHSLDPIRPATLGDPAVGTPLVIPGEASDELVRSAQERLRELVARIDLPGRDPGGRGTAGHRHRADGRVAGRRPAGRRNAGEARPRPPGPRQRGRGGRHTIALQCPGCSPVAAAAAAAVKRVSRPFPICACIALR